MLTILLGAMGLTGVGAVALYFLAPAVLTTIWSALLSLLKAILETRIGCAAIGLLIGFMAGNIWADRQAEHEAAMAAAKSRIEAMEIDRDNQIARADHAEKVRAFLEAKQMSDQDAIAKLQDELSRASLQSTQPGAKVDENALLDDRCALTERGAERLRD